MGLCWTSTVKTQTDNHTLDDQNHQRHQAKLLLSETLLSAAQASLCVGEVRSWESTGSLCGEFLSQISTCILTGYRLNKNLHLTTWKNEWSCATGFATKLTLCQTFLTMSGFQTRHIFCCQATSTLRTTSFGVPHCLSTVCKDHYTPWSALLGLPSPNMASSDHSGSRTTTSSLWQSTRSDISRCSANSGQHVVDKQGSSGSTSGSSRMVPLLTLQTNNWHGYNSVSLTDWSAAGVTQNGRHIHRTWTPWTFICGDTLKTRCTSTTPGYLWPEGSNHSNNKSDPKGGMLEGNRKLCPSDPSMPATPESSFRAHFWSPVKQRLFEVI